MLAPLHDDLEAATKLSQIAREAMNGIRNKMTSAQHGEACYDIGPAGDLTIPAFLLRKRGDGPDNTPMPKWIVDALERQQNQKGWDVKKNPIKDVPTAGGLENLSGIELAARMLKQGARSDLQKIDAKRVGAQEAKKRALRDKRLGTEAAEQAPGGYWDATNNTWRPEGYMSRAKYRRLLAGMPTEQHRKIFVEMFGHTQAPEDREPSSRSLAAIRSGTRPPARAAAPAKKDTPKKDAPKDATEAAPGGARKLNPEHDVKVTAMLSRPEGATLEEIGAAMGWQKHSASAFLTGIRKTRTIVKTVEARGNVYRL